MDTFRGYFGQLTLTPSSELLSSIHPLSKSTKEHEMQSTAVVAGILLTLTACASHTGVVSIGRDTYMIAKQQATGFPGLGNMKAEIIGEASRHCAAGGKELQVVSTQETQPPYLLGNYPRSEIQFMCLSAGDPELQRPKFQKAPDPVSEVRPK